MNALIICDSLFGNTEKIAETIAEAWRPYMQARIVAASAVTVLDLIGIGLLAIGGPTQKHGVSPNIQYVLDMFTPEKLAGKAVVAFDTRIQMTTWLSGSAAERIAKRLEKQGINVILPPESFFVEGREGPLKKGEIERAVRWAHSALEHVGVSPTVVVSDSLASVW